MPTILARELKAGHKFPSPRYEEGFVKAVCDYGMCDQDNRPDSVHVRDNRGSEFFIALIRAEELHICDVTCGRAVNGTFAQQREHQSANRGQQ